MRRRTVLSVAFVVIVCGLVLYAGWRKDLPNNFELAFQPGSQITLDLSAGGYTIRGTNENKIRVEIDPSDLPYAHSQITTDGNRARVAVDGPSNNFNVTIYVPQRSDITVYQTIGELRIVGVEGNKDLGLNIGKIWVDAADPAKMKSVRASVKIGNVEANAWHIGRGGFFRSFNAGGQGNYSLRANLDIGDIELSD